MQKDITDVIDVNNGNIIKVQIQFPSHCMWCNSSSFFSPIHTTPTNTLYESPKFASIFKCPTCFNYFLIQYELYRYGGGSYNAKTSFVRKYTKLDVNFNEKIAVISPKFIEIYTQSQIAENNNLLEIAGMGYRKALEFLIKDYLIKIKFKDDADSIEKVKKEMLSPSIKRLDENSIIDIAKYASWLGNDETHYTRKHEEKSVDDLKELIEACAYFISMKMVSINASDYVEQNSKK